MSSGYDEARAQSLLEALVDMVNSNKEVTALEKMYAISGLMFSFGEALYDKKYTTHEAVFEDYKASPSLPAALMLISRLPHEIRELLLTEAKAPEINEELWKSKGA